MESHSQSSTVLPHPVAVRATEIGHSYVSRRRVTQTLNHFNLTIHAGEFCCLLGPSGCGKSTFLRILTGLEHQTSGSVLIKGDRISGPGLDRAVVFQEPALFPWLTVKANVEFGLVNLGWRKADADRRAREALENVGLVGQDDRYPYQLSGGMRHRAAIARAWALPDAEILLMDEPFAALDAITRRKLQDYLVSAWQREPRAILYVTHDLDEAVYLADTVSVMSSGPGSVGATFKIDVERPRDRNSTPFMKARQQLDDALARLSDSNTQGN